MLSKCRPVFFGFISMAVILWMTFSALAVEKAPEQKIAVVNGSVITLQELDRETSIIKGQKRWLIHGSPQ